ncbi:MAG: methyltransferase domain-containing protein [Candidatus Nanoarchaeia archaeon]
MNPSDFKVGLLLSKANLEMSKAEATESCKVYFEIASSESINNLLVVELQSKDNFFHELRVWLNRLALTKEAFLILEPKGNEPQNEFLVRITKILKNKEIKDVSFKISTRNLSSSDGTKEYIALPDFAKQLTDAGFQKTSMTNPDLEFVIINADKQLLGVKLWENLEPFEERKAHLRPVLHPTAINPRLGRAMLNLAGAKNEVLDPFCGAGGMLLEAAEINLRATGVDIDPLMIKRAELNLKDQARIELQEGDALTWQKKTECVVTDLPYGRSSKLEGEIAELIRKFLEHYAPLTDKIVFCFPSETKFEAPTPWRVKYDFEIYIHKSLTRRIVVLGKD